MTNGKAERFIQTMPRERAMPCHTDPPTVGPPTCRDALTGTITADQDQNVAHSIQKES
jgi:hypothetical protein